MLNKKPLLTREQVLEMDQSQKKPENRFLSKEFIQSLVDNGNYNMLLESLHEGHSLEPSQVITLFKLSKKRNSNIEEDVKNYKAPL